MTTRKVGDGSGGGLPLAGEPDGVGGLAKVDARKPAPAAPELGTGPSGPGGVLQTSEGLSARFGLAAMQAKVEETAKALGFGPTALYSAAATGTLAATTSGAARKPSSYTSDIQLTAKELKGVKPPDKAAKIPEVLRQAQAAMDAGEWAKARDLMDGIDSPDPELQRKEYDFGDGSLAPLSEMVDFKIAARPENEAAPAPADAGARLDTMHARARVLADMEAVTGKKPSFPPTQAELRGYFGAMGKKGVAAGDLAGKFEDYAKAFHVHAQKRAGLEGDVSYAKKTADEALPPARPIEEPEPPDATSGKVKNDCEGYAALGAALFKEAGYSASFIVARGSPAHHVMVELAKGKDKVVISNDRAVAGTKTDNLREAGLDGIDALVEPRQYKVGPDQLKVYNDVAKAWPTA